MKDATRQRREKDEHVLVKLRNKMAELEKSLLQEVKRREETSKSLQSYVEENMQSLEARLLAALQQVCSSALFYLHVLAFYIGHLDHLSAVELWCFLFKSCALYVRSKRMDGLKESVEVLADRVTDLEKDLEYQKETIPLDIERRGVELTKRLEEFQELFEEERKSRLEREKVIVDRIAAHENQVDAEFEVERNEREQKYQELRATLEESVKLRKKRVERFHAFVENEIAILKNSIAHESRLREKEDDEIVETLTRYTTKLQASLRVINTTDV